MAERRSRKTRRRAATEKPAAQPEQQAPGPSRLKPLLELSSTFDRHFVTVDGERYDLKNPAEMSIFDQYQVAKMSEQLHTMLAEAGDDITEETASAVQEALHRICRQILIAPADVQERLNDNHRFLLVQSFTQLLGPIGAAPTGAPEAPSTGESRSPA